jgi:phosphoglycolate phosphatase-like HAD superfamily hydrolase
LKIHLSNDANSFTVVHGAKELIKYLKHEEQFEIAIATGGFLKPALFKLSSLGFEIDGLELRSSDSFASKTEMIKDIIRTHTTNKNNTFEKVVYVGDREYDYTTSTGLGIDFIGIDFTGNGKLAKAGAKNIINNFEPKEKFLEMV